MNACVLRVSVCLLVIGLLGASSASAQDPAPDTGRVFVLAADGSIAHLYGSFEATDVHFRVYLAGGGHAFSVDPNAPVDPAGMVFRYTMYETTSGEGWGRTVGGGDFSLVAVVAPGGVTGIQVQLQGTWITAPDGRTEPWPETPINLLIVPDA